MPRPDELTVGKSQIATQIRTELLERFREFARSRRGPRGGLSIELEQAMERHMAYPPPLETPPVPLPDVAASPPVSPKKAGAKPKGKGKK